MGLLTNYWHTAWGQSQMQRMEVRCNALIARLENG